MLKVYVSDISKELMRENDDDYFKRLLLRVSKQRKEKVISLKNRKDQLRSIFVYLLALKAVNAMLKETGKPPANEIVFSYGENGKPVLLSEDGMKVNMSHSGNYVACVAGRENAGIDIQVFKGYKDSVVKRYFSPTEQEALKEDETCEKAFYDIWVQKEAYIKYTGLGMKQPLSGFNVLGLEHEKTVCFSVSEECSLAVCCDKQVPVCEKVVFETLV